MTAAILLPHQLDQAVQAILSGEVVGMPTETVYGLAGDARNISAVTKIFSAKERPHFDPLIVHIPSSWSSIEHLIQNKIIDPDQLTPGMKKIAQVLMTAFWPGPLTLVLPKHSHIPDLVTSGLEQVGVRMPAHPVAQALLTQANTPLAAPSANRFGRISPTTAQSVVEELGDRIPYIIDGGPCSVGVESTVVAVYDHHVVVLRPGQIGAKDLFLLLDPFGVTVEKAASILDQSAAQQSPGMLASHYAPQKPLYLLEGDLADAIRHVPESLRAHPLAVLNARADQPHLATLLKQQGCYVAEDRHLTTHGRAEEAAQTLFSTLRALDASPAGIILVEDVPQEDGLWHAVRDRLLRASIR